MPSREPAKHSLTRLTPAPLPQAHLDAAQRLACLRLIRSGNVGPVTFRELINQFGGAVQALDALPELSRRGGRRNLRICPRAEAEAELEAAERIGARPLFTIEPGYPPALAALPVPPPLLYVKGEAGHLLRPMLAIVGARNGSAAGQKLARLFAARIGAAGLVIASGLARGIDAAAHEAALATGTVAVVAGGLDVVYPPEHQRLQAEIGERGCLVSEQPPGFVPRAQDFPRRNRIISGVSLGVVVVEAARRSGTLITARMAAEQGREVFAVPGHPLDPRAEGTNRLLKTGATLVTEPDDVLEALAPMLRQPPDFIPPDGASEPPGEPIGPSTGLPQGGGETRARVLGALGPAPVDIDELARATGLPIRSIRIALIELDLAGRIERHDHQLVSLATDVLARREDGLPLQHGLVVREFQQGRQGATADPGRQSLELPGHIGDVIEPIRDRGSRPWTARSGLRSIHRARLTRLPQLESVTAFCTFPSAHRDVPQPCAN